MEIKSVDLLRRLVQVADALPSAQYVRRRVEDGLDGVLNTLVKLGDLLGGHRRSQNQPACHVNLSSGNARASYRAERAMSPRHGCCINGCRSDPKNDLP